MSPLGRLITLGISLKITEVAHVWGLLEHGKVVYVLILTRNELGYILGVFPPKLIWVPCLVVVYGSGSEIIRGKEWTFPERKKRTTNVRRPPANRTHDPMCLRRMRRPLRLTRVAPNLNT
jgi:hypothetical protein